MPPQCETLSPRLSYLTWNTKKVRPLAGRYTHACTHTAHTHKTSTASTNAHSNSHKYACKHADKHAHTPGFLRLLLCFISFSRSQCFFNLWSHYLLTHLSSSKWFLFIFCKSPNQSWKLNAIQRSHRFQPHSLSLWKWMAAAENSDVLSHRDGVSLNVSYDLYRCCLWLKASAGGPD